MERARSARCPHTREIRRARATPSSAAPGTDREIREAPLSDQEVPRLFRNAMPGSELHGPNAELRAKNFHLAVIAPQRVCRAACEGFQPGEFVRRCPASSVGGSKFCRHSDRLDALKPINRGERSSFPAGEAREMLGGDLERRSVQDRLEPVCDRFPASRSRPVPSSGYQDRQSNRSIHGNDPSHQSRSGCPTWSS